MTTGTPDLAQLRHLLFGKDYTDLLALKAQFEHSDKYTASVAAVITEALQQREAKDQSLSKLFAPSIEQALTHTITQNPKHFADVLYPVMGPAIRKSIQQALNEALENFNRLLEQSVSPQSWRWRFDAWRTGQSYAHIALLNTLVYQVEQVFLIHRVTGLLLHHVVATNAVSKDPEIVSGMLTAIQDFIADSFTIHKDDVLHTLNLGDLTVLIEHSPHAVLAMVVRGTPPASLRTHLQSMAEHIHHQYLLHLQNFQGDTSVFHGAGGLLRQCLVQQTRTQSRKPWLAYLVLSSIIGAITYSSYQHYQQTQYSQRHAQQQTQQQEQQQAQQLQTLLADFQIINAQAAKAQQQHATNLQRIRELTQQITSQVHSFELKRTDLPVNNDVVQISRQLQDLFQTAKQENQWLQVTLIGNTDEAGSESLNQQLAQERSQTIRDALIARGVPAFILQTQAITQQPRERTVRYRIALY